MGTGGYLHATPNKKVLVCIEKGLQTHKLSIVEICSPHTDAFQVVNVYCVPLRQLSVLTP